MQGKAIYEFGTFRLDPSERQLLCDGRPVRLTPQLFNLLWVFVENADHLLSKEELRDKVWGRTYVSEHALKVVVGNLRKVLSEAREEASRSDKAPAGRDRRSASGHTSKTEGYIENVRGGGYRFTAAVQKIEASQAVEVNSGQVQDIRRSPSLTILPETNASTSNRRHLLLPATAVLLCFLVALGGFRFWKASVGNRTIRQQALSKNHAKPRVLAVLGFRNLSQAADKDWLSPALVEMLSTELASAPGLRTVSPDQVVRAKRELGLNAVDDITADSLEKIHRNLGVDLVVLGAYTALADGELRVDIRVRDISTGQIVVWKSVFGREKRLFNLVADAGEQLRQGLGITHTAPEIVAGLRNLYPSNSAATQLYMQGLDRLRMSDSLGARALFRRALAIEPDHPLLHSSMAAALSNLGYEATARKEARKAVSLAGHMPLEERLSIDAQYRRTTKEWNKAVEAYRTLFSYFPQRLDYGLQLAAALVSAGTTKDALAVIAELHRNRTFPDDGRLDLAEAYAQEAAGNARAMQQSAVKSLRKAETRKAGFLVAEALLVKARADSTLGQPDLAGAEIERARSAYKSVGDSEGVGRALVASANVLRDRGQVLIRKTMYEDAIGIFSRIGNMTGRARAINALAGVYQDLEEPVTARRKYEEALAIRRQVADWQGVGVTINNIGTIFGGQGDLRHARQKYENCLALFTKIGNKSGIALCAGNLGNICDREGNLAKATILYEKALTLNREIGSQPGVASQRENLGNVLLAQGDLQGALKLLHEAVSGVEPGQNNVFRAVILVSLARAISMQAHSAEASRIWNEALSLNSGINSRILNATNQLRIAGILVEEGHNAEAESKARAVAEQFEGARSYDALLTAREILARSLLEQDKLTAAEKEINQAVELARRTQDPRLRLIVSIISARIRARSRPNELPQAQAVLRADMNESAKRGFFLLNLESKLALAESEIQAGQIELAKEQLSRILKAANAKGLVLFVNRASELAGRQGSRQ